MSTNPTAPATIPATDRGACLALLSDPLTSPQIRCWGRMEAVEPLLWVCPACGKRIEHTRPADVLHFNLDRTPRSSADGKKGGR